MLSLKSPCTGEGITDPRRLAAPHKLAGRELQLSLKFGFPPAWTSYGPYTGSFGSPVNLRYKKYFAARQYPRVLKMMKMIGRPNPIANLSLTVRWLSSSLGASKELVGSGTRINTVFELLLADCAWTIVGASVGEDVGTGLVEDTVRVLVANVDESAADVEDTAADVEETAAPARPPETVKIEE